MLNTRFFSQVDDIIKEFLTPTMLGKQRGQMNQSIETDNEEISIGIREQEQDTRQILLQSLVSTIPMEAILEVWNGLAFIYDIKSRLELEDFTDIINPIVIKHKGRPPKSLIVSVEKGLNREKWVLKDISSGNIIEDNNTSNIIEDTTNDAKGRKCGKCKQYGHYAKTCQNI
ncbi:hypothetical protein RhiirC2_801771 [Rhizophagus irregularis]|uniref:CCHC-type domain-containing protein n=1 Tax=Rhizophagus irregularis TaxID=588596 RepID=A0A2N1M249_9GLOM|nr:hypothetical protein RhiirC2_801771 [Rhizophagus irregularis]